MYEMPASLVFGAGVLCTLTCVLIILLSVAFAVVHWLWGHVSRHNSMGIKRERGGFKIEADLQEKKPAVSAGQATARLLDGTRRNGSGPISSDYDGGPG